MSSIGTELARLVTEYLSSAQIDDTPLNDAVWIDWHAEIDTREYAGSSGERAWAPDVTITGNVYAYIDVSGTDECVASYATRVGDDVTAAQFAQAVADVYREAVHIYMEGY